MNSPLAETRESIRSTAGRAPARRDRAAYSRMIRSIWMAMPDTGQPIGRAAPASRAQLAVPLSVLAAILRQAGGDMAHTLEAFLNRHCGPNVDSRGPIVSGRRCGPIVKMKRYTALTMRRTGGRKGKFSTPPLGVKSCAMWVRRGDYDVELCLRPAGAVLSRRQHRNYPGPPSAHLSVVLWLAVAASGVDVPTFGG